MAGSAIARARLLGPAEVTVDGTPVDFDTRKALGVLAYLLVEGPAPRDTLSALFWPDSTQERARATLRRTLSSLRSGAGACSIRADRHTVGLGELSSDVTDFEAKIAEVAGHDHGSLEVCQDCVEPLAAASALYRGDFLQGFAIRGAPYFEEWERGVAESLRRRAGDCFRRLATALASSGDYVGAIASVERWIELDPLHEPAHRQMMLLRAWSGDRPGAIDAYRGFVTVLDAELAVSPLAETTELYEAILDEDLPPAPVPPRTVRVAARATAPAGDLVGRTEVLQRLDGLLEASTERVRAVCLSGAQWMGKSRLIEELTSAARGRAVMSGRAHRTEAALPYGVMVQLLQGAPSDELRRRLDPWVLDEVGRIAPVFGANAPTAADRLGEIRLLEALKILVMELAAIAPLLITIDDVQWIDRASARAMAYVLPRVAASPIMIVAASRNDARIADETHELLAAFEMIELDPLGVDDIPEGVPDPERIIAETGGIPILVAEHIGGRRDSGMIDRYLSLRLRGLSELARQVLGVASVLVGSCTHHLLHVVSGRSEDEVVDALDELTTAGVLREPLGFEDYAFALDAVAETTYWSLTLARRRLLHRRAGNALASQPRAATEMRTASLVASHLQRAGDYRAGSWFRTAGDLARRSFANAEAVELYETAVALDPDLACDVQISLGEVAMVIGDYERALSALDVASGRCDGPERGRIDHLTGEVHRILGRFELAAEHFRRAVGLHPEPALVLADWALLADRTGDPVRARALGEQALGAITEAADGATSSRVHNVIGVISSDREQALRHLDLAAELADGDDVALMGALNNKARVLADGGDVAAAMSLVAGAIELAAKTGHRHREAALRDFLADLHHRSGDAEQARLIQTEAMSLFADIDRFAVEPEVWLMSRW